MQLQGHERKGTPMKAKGPPMVPQKSPPGKDTGMMARQKKMPPKKAPEMLPNKALKNGPQKGPKKIGPVKGPQSRSQEPPQNNAKKGPQKGPKKGPFQPKAKTMDDDEQYENKVHNNTEVLVGISTYLIFLQLLAFDSYGKITLQHRIFLQPHPDPVMLEPLDVIANNDEDETGVNNNQGEVRGRSDISQIMPPCLSVWPFLLFSPSLVLENG